MIDVTKIAKLANLTITKEEAIKDHDKIVNMLRQGNFKIEEYRSEEGKKELIICDE